MNCALKVIFVITSIISLTIDLARLIFQIHFNPVYFDYTIIQDNMKLVLS